MTHTTLRKTNKLEIYETDEIRKNDVVQHPVFLDYKNEKHLVFFRVENQPQAASVPSVFSTSITYKKALKKSQEYI